MPSKKPMFVAGAAVALMSFGAAVQNARASAPVPREGIAGAPARDARPADEIHRGRIGGFDARRGILVVDGTTFRVDPRIVAFSDDRPEPAKGGLSALRLGDTVTVRGVRSNGVLQAVQVVVHR